MLPASETARDGWRLWYAFQGQYSTRLAGKGYTVAAAVQERIGTSEMPAWSLQGTMPRLLTLRDIVEQFNLLQFGAVIMALKDGQHQCNVWRLEPDGANMIDIPWIKRIVEDCGRTCGRSGFSDSAALARGLAMTCITRDLAVLGTHLYHLQESILTEAQKHAFVNIHRELVQYFEQDNLFGHNVSVSFPSATSDIREAGNCLAVGSNTATVFYLMRAAEYGLRALARDRRVKVLKGPLAIATWEDIIKQLEKAELEIQGYPKTLAREKQFEFYHGAMMEFKRFKNKFRNSVMHNRESYDAEQAKSAFNHVRDFMTILARKISETKMTPKIWKRA